MLILRYSSLSLLLALCAGAAATQAIPPAAGATLQASEAASAVPTPTQPSLPVADRGSTLRQFGPAGGAYVLGAGDELSVKVQDFDQLPDKPLRIDPDGGLDLPLIGRVQAAGLTLGQFRAVLVEKLRKYITDPQVAANIVENRSRPISVIGEVGQPGVHQLTGPRNLIEVISEAGGLKPEAGPRVIVTRQTNRGPLPLPGAVVDATGEYSTASISLDDLMASKNPAQNIAVQPNDVISVPKGDVVYVVGSVGRPGGFPLQSHETISLLQAVSLAQGIKPEASQRSAKILRQLPGSSGGKPEEIPVDVKKIFEGKAPDVALRANDILFIPNSAAKTGGKRAIDAILQVATGVIIYGR